MRTMNKKTHKINRDFVGFVWRARRDSNARSFESESNTLSSELRAHGTY